MARMVVKAGNASVISWNLISRMDSMKITAPIKQRMGPVAMDGIELKSGLQHNIHSCSSMNMNKVAGSAGGAVDRQGQDTVIHLQ